MSAHILTDKLATTNFITNCRQQSQTIALVPTMGNLHRGHLELVKTAINSADCTIVSIFVNPLQFNNQQDLNNYPRTWEQDLALLEPFEVNAVLKPDFTAMYPNGMEQLTKVHVPKFSQILEGEFREGHFDGVSTVVCKLFNWTCPDIAIFGKKDYQQLRLIQKMVVDLDFNLRIIQVPTQRLDSGLALSSRNEHLTKSQKKTAAKIYAVLLTAKQQLLDKLSINQVEKNAVVELEKSGFKVDYVRVCCQQSLAAASREDKKLVVLAAAYLEDVRLIDNLEVNLC